MNASKLKIMQVIHTAFCAAITGFAIVALIMRKERIHLDLSFANNDPYFPLFPILAVISVAVGFYRFNKQIRSLDPMLTGDDKIAAYQTAFIVRCAFIEAPALLNVVAFLIYGNLIYLIVVAAVLVAFIVTRPTKQHVIDTTGLQFPDTEKL
ncbi:MAG TPA: hypothetical protein VK541_00800 [Pedobacter sp.]|uniref:hypothetical protein n=1 Tax=Pedobacter sp. TaxID=1411316 RepID=UPI002C6CBC68|nr:hypothetical protein [Pedobacter sp.]HMI00984.1 hypothetical protein [Pedobacter sp.]